MFFRKAISKDVSALLLLMTSGLMLHTSVAAQDETDQIPVAAEDSAPRPYQPSIVGENDGTLLKSALAAAKAKRFSEAQSYQAAMTDPVAKKIVTWAMINNDADTFGFISLDAARRDLWGWPREAKRQQSAEKKMATAALTPDQIINWFNGAPPQTLDGAMLLIGAYTQAGRADEAKAIAKQWWRGRVFDATAQSNFMNAYGQYLTVEDHQARLICLLLNPQSGSTAAISALIDYADDEHKAVARAVLAMRSLSASSDTLYETARGYNAHNKVLAYERARFLLRKGLEPLGYEVLSDLPPASLSPEAASQMYTLRMGYFRSALKAKNYTAAYYAMAGGGFENGENKAEAEFFAGWMALLKLNNPDAAIKHFQGVYEAGTSPITQGRANYWLGRAHEARNDATQHDAEKAKAFYTQGGQYIYTFYGQLAAEKAGQSTITVGRDPVPSEADKARFDNREMVKAAKILGQIGEIELFRQFTAALNLTLPNAEEQALLVDLTAQYDRQVEVMRVARKSMQRGFYIPERAYPLWKIPAVKGPEPAVPLSITRQETGFDPGLKSHANARGMMQFIPSTARAVARRMGLQYNESSLYDAEYNMTLGTYHLGELIDQYDGSYIMAFAAYNAGPSRMKLWVDQCGDPRGPNADPLSFIECMPLTETRNYMMRVTENVRVYRARLNGGSAPLTSWADVTRGTAGYFGVFDASEQGTSTTPEGPVAYDDLSKTPAPVETPKLAPVVETPAKAKPKPAAKGKKSKKEAAKGKKGKAKAAPKGKATAKKSTKKKKS